MKNSKFFLIVAAVVLLAVAGCKKEDEGEKFPVEFTVDLEGRPGNDAKVHLEEVSGVWKPNWDEGTDQVRVNDDQNARTIVRNASNHTQGTVSATVSGSTYYAVFPASAVVSNSVSSNTTIKLPRVQVYETVDGVQKLNAPMAAYNKSKPVLKFKNLCGVMQIIITNNKYWDMILDSIQVQASNKALCGNMTISDFGESSSGTYMDPYVEAPNASADPDVANGVLLSRDGLESAMRIVSLSAYDEGNQRYSSLGMTVRSTRLNGDSDPSTKCTLYVYLPKIPTGTGNTMTVRVFSHPVWKDANNEDDPDPLVHIVYERTTTAANGYVARNEVIKALVPLASATPTFTSMKAFTVDGNGTQVCFSRGLVQYYNHATNSRWRFAQRQWAFTGRTSITVNYPGINNNDADRNVAWREHFPWASGNNPVYLYALNENQCEYPNNTYGDLTGSSRYVLDWGNNFVNSNTTRGIGTNVRLWRTPSRAEYDYVFKGRTATYGAITGSVKYGWARITGVPAGYPDGSSVSPYLYGCILIPDSVDWHTFNEVQSLITAQFVSPEGESQIKRRTDNTYSTAQLEYLEAKGCIFFPCIGGFFGATGGSIISYRNWDDRGLEPALKCWTCSQSTSQTHTQAFAMYFQSQDVDLGSSDVTATSLYDDAARYLNCVRLVCNFGTPYVWDPDQM